MKRIFKIKKDSLLIVLCAIVFLVAPIRLFAEATQIFVSDYGLNPLFPTDICQYVDTGGSQLLAVNFYDTNDSAPPEGKFVIHGVQKVRNNGSGWIIGFFSAPSTNCQGTRITRDLSSYKDGDIRFWIKTTNGTVFPKVQYKDASGGLFQVPFYDLGINTGGQWVEVVYPIAKLVAIGFDLTRVWTPFMVTANGIIDWSIDDVRWTKKVDKVSIYPNSTRVNPGKKRLFTVEGVDAANEPVFVTSQFSGASGLGTLKPSDPIYSLSSNFTASASLGIDSITAKSVGSFQFPPVAVYPSATAQIEVTNDNLDEKYGLLSETIPGINLDSKSANQDSSLLLYSEDPSVPPNINTIPAVSDDNSQYQEGVKSFKTIFKTKSTDAQYQGWAIEFGKDSTQANAVKDMSAYYDGSIRFWFKAPASLQNKLTVGIRSINIESGKEASKILLKDLGVQFNDQWQSVAIPVNLFAKARPYADIARTKVLFGVSVAGILGGTEADRTFYIDNLRWDTKIPGPLSKIIITPLGTTADPVLVPWGFNRQFVATGYDEHDAVIDISPTWSFVSSNLGTLNPTVGNSTILSAVNTTIKGQVQAKYGSITGTVDVLVDTVTFAQSFTVYSDLGFAGDVGIATGPADGSLTSMKVVETKGEKGVPEGSKVFRSTYTLKSNPDKSDAFAVWYVNQGGFSRYMRYFENGYLRFYVKTARDLEVSIRSENVDPNTNHAKVYLSELGVPHNNEWQDVIIPLSLFKTKEPLFDFSKIVTFFSIGGVASTIGDVSEEVFEVDHVRWLSTDARNPEALKVYEGLKNKQQSSGLVRSYENKDSAFTYDQALAAMTFTYRKDLPLAKKIFDFYNSRFTSGQGFANEYFVNGSLGNDQGREVGPNAWLLLSLLHYRDVAGDTAYDSVIDGLASWIKSFQDADGGVKFGNSANPVKNGIKSTEHNLDAYAAFQAYSVLKGGAVYQTAAANVKNWLETKAWNATEQRFNVGIEPPTMRGINTDKALDAYSWPLLALGNDSNLPLSSLLTKAEVDFGTSAVNGATGELIHGFDFGGPFTKAPDKDAVWLEGTGQMSVAYWVNGSTESAAQYLEELKKGIYKITDTSQGINYATNRGTAYGDWFMDGSNASVSAAAWYLFSEFKFNPMRPYNGFLVQVRNISNNTLTSDLTWTSVDPAVSSWVKSDQVIQLDAQSNSLNSWGIQIYTDNTNPSAVPRFVDPSADQPNNIDSNPAGLLWVSGRSTSSITIPLAWSIKNQLSDAPPAAKPAEFGEGAPDSFQWLQFKDKKTPIINLDLTDNTITGPKDGKAFVDFEDFVTVKNNTGIHATQPSFFDSFYTNYIFLQGDFSNAAAQETYKTKIYLELYSQ